MKTNKNINLSPYLTLHIHAQAEEFIEVTTKKELIDAVKYAINGSIPYYIIGSGSNVVLRKDTFPGLIIKNSYILSEIIKETNKEVFLRVSSGYPMSLLVAETVEKGWGGFEYHKGLPGTVGGGICMNSKWTRPLCYISDCLVKALLLDSDGNEKEVEKNYFHFSYGYSSLQEKNETLLETVFRLPKVDKIQLKKRAEQSLLYRKQTQPFGVSTCGCFFKNITESERIKAKLETNSVGYLIDKCQLKGTAIGNFEISNKHANFIINTKRAESDLRDLLQLVSLVKQKVKSTFGIELKEEVMYIS